MYFIFTWDVRNPSVREGRKGGLCIVSVVVFSAGLYPINCSERSRGNVLPVHTAI